MLYVEYAQSANFQNLLYGNVDDNGVPQYVGLNNYLNISWQDFYFQIFNIFTCNDDGLNIWGQMLNTGRQYYIGTQTSTFGFTVNPYNETGYAQNFGFGSFTAGGNFTVLKTGQYRCLLLLRARTYISNGSILSITKLLNDFFINLKIYSNNDGNNYNIKVSVSQDMTTPHQINYTFQHTDSPSTSLPLWVNAIFFPNMANPSSYYLPIPVGGFPSITIT